MTACPTSFPSSCLRANLRDNEVPTVINVPTGSTAVRVLATQDVWARLGAENAELPDTNEVSDGTASFPLAANVVHEFSVSGGERLSFVTERVLGTLYVGISGS